MEQALVWLQWALASGPQFVTAVIAVLSSVIALCLLIPGDQPEKALQGVVDFLSKFSIKKSE